MSAESDKLNLIRSDPRAWVKHQASPYVCSDPVATAHVTHLLADLEQAEAELEQRRLAAESRRSRIASLSAERDTLLHALKELHQAADCAENIDEDFYRSIGETIATFDR